jgi:hypothetical protein
LGILIVLSVKWHVQIYHIPLSVVNAVALKRLGSENLCFFSFRISIHVRTCF